MDAVNDMDEADPRWLGLLAFLVVDQWAIAAALPAIAGTLGIAAGAAWLAAVPFAAATVGAPLLGRLGEGIGHGRILAAALGVQAAGSCLCGFAGDSLPFLIGRAAEGLGGSGALVTGLALRAYRQDGRGVIPGGPWLAGAVLLAASFVPTWRALFLVHAALGLLALSRRRGSVPGRKRGGFDSAGVLMLACFVGCGVLMAAFAGRFSLVSPLMLGLAGAALVALLSLAFIERLTPDPLLPPALFGAAVGPGLALAFAAGTALSVVAMMQPLATGLGIASLAPVGLGLAAGAIVARLAPPWRHLPALGGLLMAVALPATLFLPYGAAAGSFAVGAGLALGLPALRAAARHGAQRTDRAAAAGAVTALAAFGLLIGTTFGAALCSDIAGPAAPCLAELRPLVLFAAGTAILAAAVLAVRQRQDARP